MRNTHLQVLELGGQLSVLLGNPVANLEELLTWSEAELLRVTSGDTGMQHTRAQVCPVLGNHWSLILVPFDYYQTMENLFEGESCSALPDQHLHLGFLLPCNWVGRCGVH